jgi:hypothetical protein
MNERLIPLTKFLVVAEKHNSPLHELKFIKSNFVHFFLASSINHALFGTMIGLLQIDSYLILEQ